MKKDVLNIEVCNTASSRETTDLFKKDSLSSCDGGAVTEGSGLIYNTSGGAGNGSQLPSNTFGHSFFDSINNIIYASTDAGLWIYDILSDTGSVINTLTSVIGDSLPTDDIRGITKDVANNVIYLIYQDTYADIWKYNINTNTGKIYNGTSGVSSGVNLPYSAHNILFEPISGNLWVSGQTFIWRLDSSNNGENVTQVVSGDPYPLFGSSMSILFDVDNNYLWVGKFNDGLYRYDILLDNGKIYNHSGGAANGDQMQADAVGYQMSIFNNIIYVPDQTGGAIWVYNIGTDTGSLINTSTIVIGDQLPNNFCYSLYINSDILYVSSANDLWEYNMSTNTGKILGSVSSGDIRPNSSSKNIFYENGMLWDFTRFAAIWRWNENFSQSICDITITSDSSNLISYEYIVNDVQQSPIKIDKIILTSDNDRQKYNSLKHIIETIAGSDVQYTVHFSNYVNPLLPFKQVHINLEEPLLIDYEQFLRITIEANTCIQLLFEYEQQSPASLIEHLSHDEKDILPIYYEETKDGKLIKTVSLNKSNKAEMIHEPEFKWLPPWVVMAIISILLQFKSKN